MKTKHCTSTTRLLRLTVSALPLLALLSIQPTWAKKPPTPQPPPPAEGIIYCYAYYNIYGDGQTTYSMAADGSDTVVVIQGLQRDSHPSQYLHGGERWFTGVLPIEGEFYPDGQQRYELCAISESGNVVQLTDDSSVQPGVDSFTGEDLWVIKPKWTMADTRVSFIGRRWGVNPETGEAIIVEEGMFVIDLPDDIANAPLPVSPVHLPIEFQDYANSYEWSPDGTAIAYACRGLYVVDVDTTVSRQLVVPSPDYVMACPAWTPDGSTIVFGSTEINDGAGAIRKVSVDGTGLITIATYDEREGDPRQPVVSPDGGFVAFDRYFYGRRHGKPGGPSLLPKSAIYLMDINGANEVKIKDMDNHLECTGWRE